MSSPACGRQAIRLYLCGEAISLDLLMQGDYRALRARNDNIYIFYNNKHYTCLHESVVDEARLRFDFGGHVISTPRPVALHFGWQAHKRGKC